MTVKCAYHGGGGGISEKFNDCVLCMITEGPGHEAGQDHAPGHVAQPPSGEGGPGPGPGQDQGRGLVQDRYAKDSLWTIFFYRRWTATLPDDIGCKLAPLTKANLQRFTSLSFNLCHVVQLVSLRICQMFRYPIFRIFSIKLQYTMQSFLLSSES